MQQDRFIQRAASANFPMEFDGPPEDFYFLLLPKATMLAVAAAIEPLRIANQLTKQQLYRWYTMSEDGSTITCSNGMMITPDMALDPLPLNSYGFVCSGVEPQTQIGDATLNWLRREDRFGRRLGSICSGAFALARAGLLKDRRFTLHWENQLGLMEEFPDLEPTSALYEVDGRIMTCGGGNSSLDMMLTLIEQRHGADLAIMVADMCIHLRSGAQTAPQRSASSAAIGCRNRNLLAAIQIMEQEIEEPLSMEEIADRLGVSRRQVERLFKRYLNQSPISYYNDLRLSRAYGMLNETDLTVTEIAAATGFRSSSHMARVFREKYGSSPNAHRKSWS
ncbi:GlxA family transcriptional regulator [Phaeobacter sp. CNT1-3]|jgi:transcriptional regulator GlxA family with amidase domain|nr:GlxA family transcriptional regulator [Phaeobacter sp. CNT1-3]